MNDEKLYMRIGVNYYKLVEKPNINNEIFEEYIPWSKDAIIDDYGRDFLKKIDKLNGFTCVPNHKNFQQVIGTFKNSYQEIPFKETSEVLDIASLKSKIHSSLSFMKHIFKEQFELGLDYLKILYLSPTQPLPILCLVSEEMGTGKTTFLKWLNLIFGQNMTYIKSDSILSKFNSDWVSKLIVGLEEVKYRDSDITNRLKFLSTTNKDKIEKKGRDREEVDFFAKFIICSNHEEEFIKIEQKEVRFWVRKLQRAKENDIEILSKLKNEIPYFLKFLSERDYFKENTNRLWFDPKDLETDALRKLKLKSTDGLEPIIVEVLTDVMEESNEDILQFINLDLYNWIKVFRPKEDFSIGKIKKVLKGSWGLTPEVNSLTYLRIYADKNGTLFKTSSVGRFYTIDSFFINEKTSELGLG